MNDAKLKLASMYGEMVNNDDVIHEIYKHHAVIHEETYRKIKFQIVLSDMGWYTCYLDVSNTKYAFMDYMSIDLDVHGGLTYSDYRYPYELEADFSKWIIGWDYAHYGDDYEIELAEKIFNKQIYNPYKNFIRRGRRYSLDELIGECKYAIRELLNTEE